ncbi:MAG: phosphoenolpyruvate carboxykinase (GTP) [Clostridiales bacterium]|nr:phosphoenolpyruvate carboxykinase (GTP) [Clostridiales bacterium]
MLKYENACLTDNKTALAWIEEMAAMTQPDKVVWIDGGEEQADELKKQACSTGELIKLNEELLPDCYLHRTAVNDVARVEARTFICTPTKEEAGNINNWMAPDEMYAKLKKLYKGSMKGKTMYVLPYSMGVIGSDFAKIGIELTDSIYVVLNMLIMTRAGKAAAEALDDGFIRGLHAVADCDPENRYIVQFPQDNTIMSVNSGYGGNVILGKKCFALRIASYLGRKEGWMAEHMLILGIEYPDGSVHYVTGAFPSACGKTNLAMLIPPEVYRKQGYKAWTVGDDIAWLRVGKDGRLWAVNPEAGFFGVAPGTNDHSNPNALATTKKETIFTNVAYRPADGTVWWESLTKEPPEGLIDWTGKPWDPSKYNKADKTTSAAHPNSRFTTKAKNCPCISSEFDSVTGVPIDCIIFGGRRARTAPLVYQSRDWQHGTFVGAIMASETTAAAAGAVGVVRRDPMAMRPFAGYNMGDYFRHWLDMGKIIKNPPLIFNVNWFRTDSEGHFIWPGFGDNMRVVMWMLKRAAGEADAVETEIGFVPKAEDINIDGLDITVDTVKELLSVDKEAWLEDCVSIRDFFAQIGDHVPQEMYDELDKLEENLKK